jgi:uncharacterized protein
MIKSFISNLRSKRYHARRLVWFGLVTALILAVASPAALAAASIPSPPAQLYVLDQADVISPQTESLIINTSQELNRLTKAQVAVVTLNSLNDQPIEEVSLGILRQWKLGDKELNNGLLILLAPSERQSRIEVGYGLEGALPDAKTGRIQDEYMLPYFTQGDYDQGLRNGYLQAVSQVAQEYGVTLNVQAPSQPQPQTDQTSGRKMPAWANVLLILGLLSLIWLDHRFFNGFILGMLLSMLFRGGAGADRGFRSSGGSGRGSAAGESAKIGEIGDGVIRHQAPTLFLRLRAATSSGWGWVPPCGCSAPA